MQRMFFGRTLFALALLSPLFLFRALPTLDAQTPPTSQPASTPTAPSTPSVTPKPVAPAKPQATPQAASQAKPPSIAEAEAWMKETEARLLELWIRASRVGFLHKTYLHPDTEMLSVEADEAVMAYTAERVKDSMRFARLKLPDELARKMLLLRLSAELPAPADAKKRKELAQIAAAMSATYGKGKYCQGEGEKRRCRNLMELSDTLAKSTDYNALLDAWRGWRTISPPMRKPYQRYVELANLGAREIGFSDVGALWRSRYDMPPEAFSAEMERLWKQVEPLYKALHCYTRTKLSERYGQEKVSPKGKIPAHLLGNMWAQSWDNLYPLLAPKGMRLPESIDQRLKDKKIDEVAMTRIAERFFTSLSMPALPASFWKLSMLKKPRDREVVCHASAWPIDYVEDVRIKQCVKIDEEDLRTLHHELGHIYYYLAYNKQAPLFQNGAHDGFHEGIGDAIALSMTHGYYQQLGLIEKDRPAPDAIPYLLKMALERIAFLPFGKLVDQWRWGVFSGKIPPNEYNKAWWALRERYQGIQSPIPRSEADFDPGAKYHIPGNTPYSRYFLAAILQFQFYRALCQIGGHKGDLHTCSFFGNKAAGERFWKMLQAGQSRPWPEILALLTGSKEMDASAILDYFAPLHRWLNEQNKGASCGW